ncbi:MAG TPA: FAD-binding oxidoreductase, partial [Kofleriaceae bacterium]
MAIGALREFARAVDHVGLEHALVPSRARSRGLYLEMAAYTLHPYKLVLGLAEHAVRAGVAIRERARVRSVEMTVSGGRAHFDDGDAIDAHRVIVCTNAYTSSLELGDRAGGVVVHSFMTATAPVDRSRLVRDGDFTVEMNTTQAYHRMHRDRIIYGGIDRLRAPAGGDFAVPGDARARLVASMKASFAGAGDIVIDEAWSGPFHTTTTGLPIIRTSLDNFGVIFNVGYGGTGVALSLTCARLVARVAVSGLFASTDDARLLAVMHATRISVRDSARAVGRIARRVAQPWRAP